MLEAGQAARSASQRHLSSTRFERRLSLTTALRRVISQLPIASSSGVWVDQICHAPTAHSAVTERSAHHLLRGVRRSQQSWRCLIGGASFGAQTIPIPELCPHSIGQLPFDLIAAQASSLVVCSS